MTPSSQPKLPIWIFIVTDLAFLGTAALIAWNSHRPYSEPTMFLIVACVIVGAVVGLVPIVANLEAQKNETLDDRQRALEALARTITSSAEQISIATSGLNEIAEIAQRNLRHAEKLPHQLHEKIAEFQAQFTAVNDAEKEELEKELATLRTSESERLDTISDKIAKSAAEWSKLETATQKHLTAATDALGKAQAQAAATLAALDAKLVALAAGAPAAAPTHADVPATPTFVSPEAPAAEGTAHPPKRPRKPRREESAEEAATAAPTESAEKSEPTPPVVDEPPPIPVEKIVEVAPVAPGSAEPFTGHISATPAATAEPAAPLTAEAAPAEPKPARKRAPKKTAPEPDPSALNLNITETPRAPSAEVGERGRSSDGATRLLVTAYIGIGNRLFIRGEGPGLAREKGIPLQFVSIGKWRWETNDATAPVTFRLFKNDETECAALGEQTLAPGDEQEVTAAF